MSNVIELPRHRKLTGVAPWPIILLAGSRKVGKTWCAVDACMSDLVEGGLWFPAGELDPDEYAQIPGFDHDRFTLVQNDGTYRDILASLDEELVAEKTHDRTTLWVLDSGSRIWDLLSEMAQHEMYERLRKKAEKQNRPVPETEQKPAVDLWNVAADRWSHIFDALRRHRGPVLITSRMELKTVMDGNGNPTKEKDQKILCHKSVPSDADVIVELDAPGHATVTGVRSVKLAGIGSKRTEFKDFTVEKLLKAMGVSHATVGERHHSGIDPEDKPAQAAAELRSELMQLCTEKGWAPAAIGAQFAKANDGVNIEIASAASIAAFLATKRQEAAA